MSIPSCLSTAPGILAAELTIDGLALCCFNQIDTNNEFWEVAYIRHKKHSLSIAITKVLAAGGTTVIRAPTPIPKEVLSFGIGLDTGTNDIYQNFPQGGCRTGNFNRTATSGNDDNDIRWMIDFSGTEPGHGRVTRLKPRGGGRIEVTLATLHHTLLFTKKPTDLPVRLVPRCSSDPSTDGFELGRTNGKLGGAMKAPAAGNIVFTGLDGFQPPFDPLPFDAQTSYRIDIINEDQFNSEHWPGLSKGDFHFFYEVIEVDGQQKELWAAVTHDRFSNAPDGDCNGSFISPPEGSLEGLIQ